MISKFFNRFIGASCGVFLLTQGAAAPVIAQSPEQNVPFLTTRDVDTPSGPVAEFGDARSTLRAGNCTLQEVNTGAFSNILDGGPAFVREQLLNINGVTVQPSGDLLAKVQSGASDGLALYVHGYYIDFEKGCRRAALLQKNAHLGERMVWFTWPSDGDIANYVQDEADLYWSVPDIAAAIIDLNARSHAADGVDIIGHSLGARGVALALAEVAFRAPETRLGRVVLLAPDMDFAIFARLLPRIRPIANSITIYVSDRDRPLDLSKELHGYPRLGQAGNDVSSWDGVDVIDVSQLPKETTSGHLYHIHSSQVGQDLDLLLNRDVSANERSTLKAIGPNTWALLPK